MILAGDIGATAIRAKLLKAFEIAEIEVDPAQHPDLLTFVLVGAGPTGVEMARAIADMLRGTLKSDFRRIDPRSARIILVEGAPRILPTFAESLSQKAYARLVRMGVEIRTNALVERVDAEGVVVGGERIASRTVLWMAGVMPSPAGQWRWPKSSVRTDKKLGIARPEYSRHSDTCR